MNDTGFRLVFCFMFCFDVPITVMSVFIFFTSQANKTNKNAGFVHGAFIIFSTCLTRMEMK